MDWWTKSADAGIIKEKIYLLLQKLFSFNLWHVSPINFRPYALEIINFVNNYISLNKNQNADAIIEVGCGLGELIGNITYRKKIGFDVDKNVLKAGVLLFPKVEFHIGSFQDIKNYNIKCLIMVNFIHEISTENMHAFVQNLIKYNKIELFVIDILCDIEGTEYKYKHDGNKLFGSNYTCIKRSQGFPAASGARRVIEYWEINNLGR